ncbi:hypothetical protein CPT_Sansa73 [Caulobacter phage Sansa]|uniref:Uncharacterized protein n=1 Tax=Caulobacter phage Sansa TaxID=1675600 RepID=A0A0K1LLT7_9CAUD|nr:hypothetical protein HOR07_gp073 [Caulobacter phage Sansa]AKU43477.1 hypothetical protein CPT_Sansa73 [Caulobacter phage Sansa]
MTRLQEALTQLREHQDQLDADGCRVGVSREALDIVLSSFNENPAPQITEEGVARRVAGMIGDAVGYFWNAALIPTHEHGDATANAVMSGMVSGMAAIASNLERHSKEQPHV